MIRTFLLNATPFEQQKVFDHALSTIPPELRIKALRYKNVADQAMSLGGSLLIQEGLAAFGETFASVGIPFLTKGKPLCTKKPHLHFNIAHSGGMVIGAFSDLSAVGVDIESLSRKVPQRVVDRFLHSLERQFLENLVDEKGKQETFFQIWTRKESYAKAKGIRLVSGLPAFLPEATRIFDDSVWYFHQYRFHGWLATLCARVPIFPKCLERVSLTYLTDNREEMQHN